jgi:tetratricopeptide (TPR) repeat protein
MVGVAFFEHYPPTPLSENSPEDVLVVRQYFLRDPGDEPAMLLMLSELVANKRGLITFNGRTFDLPLLDNRYLLNRLPNELPRLPHIDLLLASRRIWRARLGSCALSALEENLLGLRRTQDDVPGWLIPALYANYLRTGDARELMWVFYHNQMDVLSMVTLAGRVIRQLSYPEEGEGLDLLSLGRWQADLGFHAEAEQTLRRALDRDLPLEAYHQALYRLSNLYKQAGRRAEAVLVWQQIAFTSTDDIVAYIELAKHFEWQEADPAIALAWTQQALDLVERWLPSVQKQYAQGELHHRRERLLKKLT